jgi:hypothetical protein
VTGGEGHTPAELHENARFLPTLSDLLSVAIGL